MTRVLARVREEARARPRETEIGSLAAGVEGGTVVVGEGASTLDELEHVRVPEVRLAPGLYAGVVGRRARIALLERVRRTATERVVVHVRVDDVGGRAARVLVDGPRALAERVAHRLGRESPLPAPGDRLEGGRHVHLFTDDEPLLREMAEAGFVPRERDGARFVLVHAEVDSALAEAEGDADAFVLELLRAARTVREAERARRAPSPESAVTSMRMRGKTAVARGPIARARLRRAIGWVDAVQPGGPNCYRRTLLELALDRGAAAETLVFGLDVGRNGHVAFKGREELGFDVLFELDPT